MKENRTKNTIRNVKAGAIVQIVNKVMAFIVRTVFIKVFSSEYLGINGLFSSILTVIAFAELGMSTALNYYMYKPVALENKEKIKSLTKFYRETYCIVGIIIFLLGLGVIPFLDVIVNTTENIHEDIILIYILFLTDTAVSYFGAHKKAVINVHQQQSAIDNIDSVFYFVKRILEIIFLILTKNYIVYLVMQILGTVIENLITIFKANKMYPYLKEEKVEKISKKEKKKMLNSAKNFVIYRMGLVLITSTDNILISIFTGTSIVGLVANYTLIINSVKLIISSALNSVAASVGNLNVLGDKNKKEKIFYDINFINYIAYSFIGIIFMFVLNPFIEMWLGGIYVLDIWIVVALSINFFIEGLRETSYIYRSTLNLFDKAKSMPYISTMLNIILSITLFKFLGIAGIFIATAFSKLFTYLLFDTYLIYKYEFKKSMKEYLKISLKYISIFSLIMIISIIIYNILNVEGILGICINLFIGILIFGIINYISFRKSEEFKSLKKLFSKVLIINKN